MKYLLATALTVVFSAALWYFNNLAITLAMLVVGVVLYVWGWRQ